MSISIKNLIRALRLPFVSVSVLPFIFGSLHALPNFFLPTLFLGLLAAICTHLSANLINDYADSKAGTDWKDRRFFKFFGGSKLIQEGVLAESFYLNLAISFAAFAFICVIGLALMLKSIVIVIYYLIILFLGWAYSQKPWQFCYRRLGEVVIFILFGPALVMGGFFIQTKLFPTLDGFILSLPFGLLTTAILYANEVPDYPDDREAGKCNWVGFLGVQKAYIIYDWLISLCFLSIMLSIYLGYLGTLALFSLIMILPALKAAKIIKNDYADKEKLVLSSKLTIAVHASVSLFLIIDKII
ncbi:MAG: prenyltransferase [Candidatus Omnitrophica bacterium]|nr:prenyltransferase [Candidatus Omnitrophota bacterium]